jgi:predicted permease
MGRERRVGLFATMTVVALVLVIACANIANLLLARATARQQEISVRMAIGAGRSRIIRQLLTESVLLSLLGLPGGLVLAHWGAKLLVGLVSSPRQLFQLDLSMDSRVLLFTTGMALITGLLFGLAPALRATRISTNEVLKRGARGSISGSSRFHLGKALVAAQVALSLALLVAAGLFIGTLRNLLNVSLGFDQRNVLAVRVDTLGRVPKEQRLVVFTEVLDRVRQVPGVVSAGSVAIVPISGQGWNGNLLAEGKVAERGDRSHMTWFNRVSPRYFETMKTPVIRGRDFNAQDVLGGPQVMIIGERTARECFGEANPLGKFVSRGTGEKFEVIGVVKDTKYRNVQEAIPRTAFVPQAQEKEPGGGTTLMVRSELPPAALIPGLRAAITRTHPTLSLDFSVMDHRIRETLQSQRLIAILTGFFGALALFLAIVGLYGVTSYAVAQRRGEIGLRMALGAGRGNILWLVLRDVALILSLGAGAGIAISLGAGKYLGSIVYGLNPTAPAILLGAAVILGAAGLLAGLLPAMRASKLDPSLALRQE